MKVKTIQTIGLYLTMATLGEPREKMALSIVGSDILIVERNTVGVWIEVGRVPISSLRELIAAMTHPRPATKPTKPTETN